MKPIFTTLLILAVGGIASSQSLPSQSGGAFYSSQRGDNYGQPQGIQLGSFPARFPASGYNQNSYGGNYNARLSYDLPPYYSNQGINSQTVNRPNRLYQASNPGQGIASQTQSRPSYNNDQSFQGRGQGGFGSQYQSRPSQSYYGGQGRFDSGISGYGAGQSYGKK